MKQTFDKELTHNDCVRLAYFQILKQAKQMLATIEYDELSCTLERTGNGDQLKQGLMHEFINPLLYLRLELQKDGRLAINFGIEEINKPGQLSEITSQFLRLLYRLTMKDAYPTDIEPCVRTDWFLKNTCSEAYEYIEERNKYHTFRKIKYKVTPHKRKQILSVA